MAWRTWCWTLTASAATWLTRRWDSFRLVSPDHLNELPGGGPVGPDPDAFPPAADFVAYLERYAASFGAPVEAGVRVERVAPAAATDGDGGPGFRLETSAGAMRARAVVVATGAFGDPVVPALSGALPARITQLTTDAYRSPAVLPPGGVLVVGSGQSGCQIADELARAGRETWLAVGRWGWVPRRPWGTDQMDWRRDMGDFARIVGDIDPPVLDYPFTPMARWGTADFHLGVLADSGVRLVGRVLGVEGERLTLATDVSERIADADAFANAFLARVHAFGTGQRPGPGHGAAGGLVLGSSSARLAAPGPGSRGRGHLHGHLVHRLSPRLLVAGAAGSPGQHGRADPASGLLHARAGARVRGPPSDVGRRLRHGAGRGRGRDPRGGHDRRPPRRCSGGLAGLTIGRLVQAGQSIARSSNRRATKSPRLAA